MDALNQIEETIVWPVHLRVQKKLEELNWQPGDHIQMIEPVGYVDMAMLEAQVRVILTDSGGMQKEAYWLGVPCITLRDETEWVETVESGQNRLVGAEQQGIINTYYDYQNHFIRSHVLKKIKFSKDHCIRLVTKKIWIWILILQMIGT